MVCCCMYCLLKQVIMFPVSKWGNVHESEVQIGMSIVIIIVGDIHSILHI